MGRARVEAAIDAGAGVRGEVAGGLVTLGPSIEAPAPAVPEPVPLTVPGEAAWGGGRVVATVAEADIAASPFAGERLDLDRIVAPLSVGPPRPGDRFDPLGLDGRSMPLADFLRGRRVPRAERPGVPVVRDEAGILWVVGHRIGHRARLTEVTRRVAVLRWGAPLPPGRPPDSLSGPGAGVGRSEPPGPPDRGAERTRASAFRSPRCGPVWSRGRPIRTGPHRGERR